MVSKQSPACLSFYAVFSCLARSHLNTVQPGLGEYHLEYPWSTYKTYASGAVDNLLDQQPLLVQFSKNPFRARKEFVRFVKSRMGQGRQEEFYKAKDQRFLRSEEFVEKVQGRLGERGVFGYLLSIPEIVAGAVSGLGISTESIYNENRNRPSRSRLRLLFSSCSLYRNGFPDGKNLLPGLCNDLLVNLVCNPENSLD